MTTRYSTVQDMAYAINAMSWRNNIYRMYSLREVGKVNSDAVIEDTIIHRSRKKWARAKSALEARRRARMRGRINNREMNQRRRNRRKRRRRKKQLRCKGKLSNCFKAIKGGAVKGR